MYKLKTNNPAIFFQKQAIPKFELYTQIFERTLEKLEKKEKGFYSQFLCLNQFLLPAVQKQNLLFFAWPSYLKYQIYFLSLVLKKDSLRLLNQAKYSFPDE